MARKDLSDFNYDYQAYANYLESAKCANDEGYDTYVDTIGGNIYERTNDDWTKGHGHKNVNNGYDRDKNDERSGGRNWKNPWLKYAEKLNLSSEEIQYLNAVYNYKQSVQNSKLEKNNILSKRR